MVNKPGFDSMLKLMAKTGRKVYSLRIMSLLFIFTLLFFQDTPVCVYGSTTPLTPLVSASVTNRTIPSWLRN